MVVRQRAAALDGMTIAAAPPAASGPVERTVKFGETEASVLLDLLRGLAALVVVAEHWRNTLFVDYRQLPRHKALWTPAYLLTAAGHEAVVIFFVLSGYLIGGSIFRALREDRWSWTSYGLHRLVRLWVVVGPGLLLCAACDSLGLALHRAPLLYAGLGSNHMTSDVLATRTWPVFLGNLFFLQGIRVPMFGSDGALWSLADEFWYYVLFPLGLFAVWRGTTLRRLACAAAFALVCWFVKLPVLISFPVWLLGVVLVHGKAPEVSGVGRWTAGVLYVALMFFLARFRGLSGIVSDAVLAVATLVFLWVLLSAKGRADAGSARVRATRLLARGSFTLYVVHLPVLVLLTSMAEGDTRWVPGTATLAKGLMILLVTLLIAYGLAFGTEFRTDSIRRWIERRVGLAA